MNIIHLEIRKQDTKVCIDETDRSLNNRDWSCSWLFTTKLSKIDQLIHLRQLRLDQCGLGCLPDEIGNLAELESLFLIGNQLSKLPGSFARLHLMRLDLSKNQFTRFPLALCEMTSLDVLMLNDNQIERLPNTNLHLRLFYCERNRVSKLPNWIFNCTFSNFLDNPCYLCSNKSTVTCDRFAAGIDPKYLARAYCIECINIKDTPFLRSLV